MRGQRITIEGHDGTGKTSLIKKTRSALLRKGFDVVTFKSLDKSYLNPRVLFRVATGEFNQEINAMLIKHRYEFKKSVDIDPALNANLLVITDRGLTSLEHKIRSRGVKLGNLDYLKSTHPETTIVLHPQSWEVSYNRIKNNRPLRRPETGYKRVVQDGDVSADFYKKGYNLFYNLVEKRLPKATKINCDATPEKVLNDTLFQLFKKIDMKQHQRYMNFSEQSYSKILSQLESNNPVISGRSIAELGYRGKTKKLNHIHSKIISCSDELIVRNYLQAVINSGHALHLEEISPFLSFTNAHIRETAIPLLRNFPPNNITRYLIQLSADTDKDVRYEASKELLKQPVETLTNLFASEYNNPVISAVLALRTEDTQVQQELAHKITYNSETADLISKLLGKNPKILPKEITYALIFNPKNEVRRNYLLEIADDVLPIIPAEELLNYRQDSFGKLCTLEYIAATQAYDQAVTVAKQLKSTDWQVSKAATETLIGLNRRDLILETAYEHLDFNVRRRLSAYDNYKTL